MKAGLGPRRKPGEHRGEQGGTEHSGGAQRLGAPPVGQQQAAGSHPEPGEQAAGGREIPVDRGRADHVEVQRSHPGGGQCGASNAAARPAVHPQSDSDQCETQPGAAEHPRQRAEPAALHGKHQQQHQAEQSHRPAHPGEQPAAGALALEQPGPPGRWRGEPGGRGARCYSTGGGAGDAA